MVLISPLWSVVYHLEPSRHQLLSRCESYRLVLNFTTMTVVKSYNCKIIIVTLEKSFGLFINEQLEFTET